MNGIFGSWFMDCGSRGPGRGPRATEGGGGRAGAGAGGPGAPAGPLMNQEPKMPFINRRIILTNILSH